MALKPVARTPYHEHRPLNHACSCCGGPVEWPKSDSCGRCEGNRFIGECFKRGYDPKVSALTPIQWLRGELDELARLRGGDAP